MQPFFPSNCIKIVPSDTLQNLKILEDINKKQQLLSKGGSGSSDSNGKEGADRPTSTTISQRERTALQHAMQNSTGYFISTDSSFGNVVLPVLPRIPKD